MTLDELLKALDAAGPTNDRTELYDALSRHDADDRAWSRLLSALEEEPDERAADFVLKAALRPFKSRHVTLVPRLVERFSAEPDGRACSRLVDAVRHWVKVLPTATLASVPPPLRARLGWTATPPRAPAAERLEAALDALHDGDPAPYLRWRALDIPSNMDARRKLLQKVEHRLVRLGEGERTNRLLAIETLATLGASSGLSRELSAPLERTSGIVDLVEDVPSKKLRPTRELGWGAIETVADCAWLVGASVTPLSTSREESRFRGDVWIAGPVAVCNGESFHPIVERTDQRAKGAAPTLRLCMLRIAERVTVEGTFPARGDESFAVAGRMLVVGGRSLRAFEGATQRWAFDVSGRELRALSAIGDERHVFASSGDELHCLETETGIERWSSPCATAKTTSPLAASAQGLWVWTGNDVRLLDMRTGAEIDRVAAEFGRGILSAGGDLWLWDGTSLLGEPIVSGLSLGTRTWRAGSRLDHHVERSIKGNTVTFSPTAARWDGDGVAIDWPLGVGVAAVGPTSLEGSVLLAAGAISPSPWAWFDLPMSG